MKTESRNLWVHKILLLLIAGAAVALAIIYWMGCRRTAPPPTEASADHGTTLAPLPQVADPYEGPLDTLRRVRRYRLGGRVAAIAPYLVPEQRDAVIEHILSMDELTSAGESLKARVKRVLGAGSADAFDRTAVANALGPFSRDVEYVSEVTEGDTAVVIIRVGGRLPLEQVNLVRGDKRWLIQTDPPVPGVSAELRKLARALERVADDVDRRQLSAEQIEKELTLRQRPILERIDQLVRVARADQAPTER